MYLIFIYLTENSFGVYLLDSSSFSHVTESLKENSLFFEIKFATGGVFCCSLESYFWRTELKLNVSEKNYFLMGPEILLFT